MQYRNVTSTLVLVIAVQFIPGYRSAFITDVCTTIIVWPKTFSTWSQKHLEFVSSSVTYSCCHLETLCHFQASVDWVLSLILRVDEVVYIEMEPGG